MTLILKVGAILLVFAATSFLGTWLNVGIPEPMITVISAVAANLWSFDGILPIGALFSTAFSIISFMLFWFIFKLIWSVLGGGNDLD